MYSFIICIVLLVIGYFLYGRFVERVFAPTKRPTPAITKTDGVDYVPMPQWKVFMIQFLNIAGTGPIFGAIMGAKFGPSSYIWITLGCIFAGAVHDYFCGMMSIRNDGASLPDLVGMYISNGMKKFMLAFSILLLLLVGVVFVYSPALILGDLAPIADKLNTADAKSFSVMFWVVIVFVYYVIATLLPIDKLIGKVYPLFAFCLLFMALGLGICLLVKWPAIPEFWDGLANRGPDVGVMGQPIFPCLFITIACGAISGFHATQSPLMARCTMEEKEGRHIFYGAMVVEGIVALIWAAVSSYFFFDGGMEEVQAAGGQAPQVVTSVSRAWLGWIGGILAIIGVVAAPITSGDTAFRSARLILADFLGINQKEKRNRILMALPIFSLAILLLWYNISDSNGFNTIWRYFGWANQTLAGIALWVATDYLCLKYGYIKYDDTPRQKKPYYFLTMIPACFMTSVSITYICVAQEGFRLPAEWAPAIGIATFGISAVAYYIIRSKRVYHHPVKI